MAQMEDTETPLEEKMACRSVNLHPSFPPLNRELTDDTPPQGGILPAIATGISNRLDHPQHDAFSRVIPASPTQTFKFRVWSLNTFLFLPQSTNG